MSDTYHLVCVDCEEQLWIGQREAGSPCAKIYSGKGYVFNLALFLNAHRGHELRFVASYETVLVAVGHEASRFAESSMVRIEERYPTWHEHLRKVCS